MVARSRVTEPRFRELTATAEDLRDPLPAESGSSADVCKGLTTRASKRDRNAQLLTRLGCIRGRSFHAA